MAEDKDKKEGEAEPPKKSKKKLFIIIGVVLVLILGGAGAFFMLGSKKAADDEEGEEAEEEEKGGGEHGGGGGEHGELPGSITPLDPFIVNLQVKGSFLKTAIQLEFGEPKEQDTLGADMPKIRDSIIRVLSTKSAADILSPEGKEKLKDEVKDAVNNALGSEDVINIYFTEFIVQ